MKQNEPFVTLPHSAHREDDASVRCLCAPQADATCINGCKQANLPTCSMLCNHSLTTTLPQNSQFNDMRLKHGSMVLVICHARISCSAMENTSNADARQPCMTCVLGIDNTTIHLSHNTFPHHGMIFLASATLNHLSRR